MNSIRTNRTEKLFAFALVCSIWTQVRIASIIGISEIIIIILAFWGNFSNNKCFLKYQKSQNRFFLVIAIIIPVGFLWNCITVNNHKESLHDLFALIFVFILSYFVIQRLKIYNNLMGILYKFLTYELIINILYFVMYFNGMGMYYEERFEGLSYDPNQLAEVLFIIPWVSIYFLKKLREKKPEKIFKYRFICIACLISSITIGIWTESDSFMLSTIVACIVFLFMSTYNMIIYKKANWIIIFIDIVILLYIVINYNDVVIFLNDYINKTAHDDNQLSTRVNVWRHGFEAFLNSPIVGNGPGAFSGNWFAFGNVESHNTFIYILMDFGIVGMIFFLKILYNAWKGVKDSTSPEMIAGFVGFLIFNWFHSFHRMPLFWFYIYLFISVGIIKKTGGK